MKTTESLLGELIELQKASIRLQKFAISLQAEALVHASYPHQGDTKIEKLTMKTVQQIRATLEKVEKGKALPK
jgi:hypothetical protein